MRNFRKPLFFLAILLVVIFSPVSAATTEYAYGTITDSIHYDGDTYNGAKAFDNDAVTYWAPNTAAEHWIKNDYGAGVTHVINNYTWLATSTSYPIAWTFQGSNDDAGYTTLDTRAGEFFHSGVVRNFSASNTVAYRYYKFVITSGAGGDEANEIELVYDYVPDTTPPKSITNLGNETGKCEDIRWTWENPTDSDYSHLYTLKNNVFWANQTNATVTVNWTGLTGGTLYTFSSRTFDLSGNGNTTWVNGTATPSTCPVPPTTTTTTPAPGLPTIPNLPAVHGGFWLKQLVEDNCWWLLLVLLGLAILKRN